MDLTGKRGGDLAVTATCGRKALQLCRVRGLDVGVPVPLGVLPFLTVA